MVLSKEIINVLDYLCGKFGIAIDWTSENVMPYLEDLCGRYIEYEVYTSIAYCVILAAIIAVVGLVWGIGSIVDRFSRSRSDIPEVFSVFFFVFLAIGFFVWAVQAFDIIECYTIPEKTILEYLKFLMNNSN
jgi:hypothetical protein